ncbi:MAG: TetR/AcrR family transcriptional regulator [Hespellia sp.]|nr:TetR/AcrR family transcriptional regulator [Hespellia sp.]
MSDMINGKIAKSEQTKQRITQTFLHLIEKKRWDKITVKELCSNASITRGTFYQYYSDIYELMEQIQMRLIEDLTNRYESIGSTIHAKFPLEDFVEKYDYEPPQAFLVWYEFSKENKDAIRTLLHVTNGDSYFEKKLENIISKYMNVMMDNDGLPRDELRSYFVKACSELHLFSVRTWLDNDGADFVSVLDIVNLLNTMRVGAGYLTFKRGTEKPAFKEKISIPEEN